MMNKKAFIASWLLDLMSWLIMLLVGIMFLFIFRFTAQQSNFVLSSTINHDAFYPSLYLLQSPQNSFTVTEMIIESKKLNNYDSLDKMIRNKYNFKDKNNIYSYLFKVCDEPPSWSTNCHSVYGGPVLYEGFNPHVIQLPSDKKTHVYFIHSK